MPAPPGMITLSMEKEVNDEQERKKAQLSVAAARANLPRLVPSFIPHFFLFLFFFSHQAYGSPRSDRFGNASSDSLPRAHPAGAGAGAGNGAGGGALDTLMADLMNSFGSDIHDVNTRPDDAYGNSDTCAACGDDFDYRDDVCNANRKVRPRDSV